MKNRGVALITTLMISGVLLIMLGAFVQLNRDHFSILGNSQEREACLRTAMSVHEYCVMKVETDKTWASANFTADQGDPESLPFLVINELSGTRTLQGEIPSLHTTFTAQIDNQLATNERVLLTVEVTSGQMTRTTESVLRPAPLYDAGVAAGGGINIDASRWVVGSRDPYRNLVRARQDILAPDYNDIDFTGKNNSDGEMGNDKGFFWSKNDIAFFSGGSYQSVTDPLVMQDAMNATDGRFVPNSGLSHPLHDLQVDDVRTPTGSSEIPAGEYRFTEVTASYENYEQTGTNMFGSPIYDWVPRVSTLPILGRYLGGSDPTEYWFTDTALGATVRNVSLPITGTPHARPSATFFLDPIADGGQNLIQATLDLPGTTPAFNVQADGAITIPGNLEVTSTGDTPDLVFSGNSSDAQIKARGDITFEGSINGRGVIISETGNVNLQVSNASTSGNQLGVSIYAANNITMSSIGSGSFDFSGLLYARENVQINGVGQDFNVDGALVARNGNINIATTGTVDLTYNPEHLEVLVKELPNDRTKLETLVWKE